MNILFIYPRMFHPHRGGIERVSDLLCRELIKRKHKVLFLHNICDESLLISFKNKSSFLPGIYY